MSDAEINEINQAQPVKKIWATPKIQDQSILSTAAKVKATPEAASPAFS